jgi:GNAT superfamily N-acetyltransferase
MEGLSLRKIQTSDCKQISAAFTAQGWHKPISLYQQYLDFQTSGERDIIIAESEGTFVGYLTIAWQSDYLPFREKEIPEIVDFNVLKTYQRRGIGTQLMDEAERRIKTRGDYAGIGFGMYKDYGPAQILYIKRGYIPDGNGVTYNRKPLSYGESLILDDEIALYLMKRL